MTLSTVSNVTHLYNRVYSTRNELAVDVDSVSKDGILDVAVRIRSVPYPFVDRYRVGTTLELGDFNYFGQLRDGDPMEKEQCWVRTGHGRQEHIAMD